MQINYRLDSTDRFFAYIEGDYHSTGLHIYEPVNNKSILGIQVLAHCEEEAERKYISLCAIQLKSHTASWFRSQSAIMLRSRRVPVKIVCC